jgi:hypothetical protein
MAKKRKTRKVKYWPEAYATTRKEAEKYIKWKKKANKQLNWTQRFKIVKRRGKYPYVVMSTLAKPKKKRRG